MNNKFEDPTFDKLNREEEKDLEKEKVKKLELFLEKMSESLKKEGVPVNTDCRINEKDFEKIYSKEEIKKDISRIEEYKNNWGDEGNRKESSGEKLEMLKTAIFHKFMNKDFIIVRSSQTDDVDNKIDNVILDRKTGEIVSAFDELNDEIGGYRYKEKAEKIMEKNHKGASLKYGLTLNPDKKIILQKINRIPIFYLALPPKQLEDGIKNFQTEKFSDYEKKLFHYFILSIETQIKGLELRNDIPQDIQEKLKRFSESLKNCLK